MAQEGRHAAPLHLFDALTRHRHRAGTPIPRHRHHVLKSVTLMTDIRCEAHASPMRQVQQKHLMAGRVAGRFYQPHGAVREQIKIAVDLKDVELANILKVVLAISRTSPGVGPERVANLVTLHNVHCIRKVGHAAGMIEMQVRVDNVAHILGAIAQTLKLGVDRMLAFKALCPERCTQPRSPIFVAAIWIGDYVVDPRVPEDSPLLGMLNYAYCCGYFDDA